MNRTMDQDKIDWMNSQMIEEWLCAISKRQAKILVRYEWFPTVGTSENYSLSRFRKLRAKHEDTRKHINSPSKYWHKYLEICLQISASPRKMNLLSPEASN